MKAHEEKALELLKSDKILAKSDPQVHEILYEFLKECDPSSKNLELSLVFDIVVNFFKPVQLIVEDMDREVQKKLTLYLLSRGPDIDFTLQELMKNQKELNKLDEHVRQSLLSTGDKLNKFENDLTRVNEKEKVRSANALSMQAVNNKQMCNGYNISETQQTMARLGLSNPAIYGETQVGKTEAHEISEATFEFSIEKNEKTGCFSFKWLVHDPLVGTRESGTINLTDASLSGMHKMQIMEDYMTRRVGLIQKKQNQFTSRMNQLDTQQGNIALNKDVAQASQMNYEEYKRMMEQRYAEGQKRKIRGLRESLIEMDKQKNNLSKI